MGGNLSTGLVSMDVLLGVRLGHITYKERSVSFVKRV